MKKKMVTALLAVSMLAGLSAVNVMAADDGGDTITVGFSQVGAESDWRTANTESMKSTFSEENGYELIFDDAQQKQENQLTAIRNFIQQEVDYIVLAPVTETGWDTVLQEAKDAGIPVIIVDRMVDVSDDSLYTAWVGSNFKLEGQILVMSFDTTNAGLTQTLSGEITCDTECNPLHGPRVEEIIQKLEAGEDVDKQAYVDEVAFAADDTVTKVTIDGTDYDITPITQEIIDGRAY